MSIAAAIGAVAVSATAARGLTGSPCNAGSGVTVVVDFTHWGGGIRRGCAAGTPGSALDALHAAGFATAGTAQYGDAFVCRVGNLPSVAEQSCVSTPPANAFWALYYAASADTGWSYSALGALSLRPAAGSIEAWAFGAKVVPGVSPASAAAVPPPPTTAPRVPPTTAVRPVVTRPGATAMTQHSSAAAPTLATLPAPGSSSAVPGHAPPTTAKATTRTAPSRGPSAVSAERTTPTTTSREGAAVSSSGGARAAASSRALAPSAKQSHTPIAGAIGVVGAAWLVVMALAIRRRRAAVARE